MDWTLLLAILIGILYPLYFLLTYKKTNEKILQNEALKLVDYKQTIAIFWSLTCLVLANYFALRQPDLNFYPTFNLVGTIVLVVISILAVIQRKISKVTQENYQGLKDKLKPLYHYLPRTKIELNWWILLSISAGICEEIIFRLFFYEYLLDHVGIWVAVLLTNIVFALTHIGSGKQNLMSAFILGLVFSAIYIFTENIWIAILLHIVIDINSGILGYKTKNFKADR